LQQRVPPILTTWVAAATMAAAGVGITVLQDVGFGFLPTASCSLGKFQPIDDQVAEDLLAQSERADTE
jgi:hypothetical protein